MIYIFKFIVCYKLVTTIKIYVIIPINIKDISRCIAISSRHSQCIKFIKHYLFILSNLKILLYTKFTSKHFITKDHFFPSNCTSRFFYFMQLVVCTPFLFSVFYHLYMNSDYSQK